MSLNANILVKVQPGGHLQATAPITLKNTINDVTRLDQLKDVVEPLGAVDNSTLVYDSLTDKYRVQEINLDGGTF